MGKLAVIFEEHLVGLAAPILAVARVPGVDPQRCAVLHYSREGACVSAAAELPDYFILREIDSRIERLCRVIWRDETIVGVEYINARTMGRSAKRTASSFLSHELTNVIALYPT